MTYIGLLERFPGYTLATLKAEDAELVRLVRMVDREREVNGDGERSSHFGTGPEFE